MRILVYILLFNLASLQAFGLDARDELRRISKHYADAKGCSMKMTIAVFEKADDAQPMTRFTGEMRRRSDAYYSSVMGQTTLINTNCQVIVDEAREVIYYDGRNNSQKKFKVPETDLGALLDSSLSAKNKMSFLAQSAERNSIELLIPSGLPAARTVIHYHPTSLVIQEIVYYYDQKDKEAMGKAVISYSNVQIGPEPDASLFSEKQFIVKKSSQLLPAPKWNGYQVIDLTPELKTNTPTR